MKIPHTRASFVVVSAVASAVQLTACGGTTGYGQGANTASQADSPAHPAPLSAAPNAGAVGIATRTIPGIGTVLVDGQGLTLYRLPTDTSTTTACTGSCAQIWPPLLTTSGTPASPPGVSGRFATLTRPDAGVQVTFDGMPLYTYVGDTQPGQANGQGIDGFAAVTS